MAAGDTLLSTTNLSQPLDSFGRNFASQVAESEGRYFFPLFTPDAGTELWVSEGGPARQVADLTEGSGSTSVRNMQSILGGVVFHAEGDQSGIYFSDGTAEGTKLISTTSDSDFIVAGDQVFYSKRSPDSPSNLDVLMRYDLVDQTHRFIDSYYRIEFESIGVKGYSPYAIRDNAIFFVASPSRGARETLYRLELDSPVPRPIVFEGESELPDYLHHVEIYDLAGGVVIKRATIAGTFGSDALYRLDSTNSARILVTAPDGLGSIREDSKNGRLYFNLSNVEPSGWWFTEGGGESVTSLFDVAIERLRPYISPGEIVSPASHFEFFDSHVRFQYLSNGNHRSFLFDFSDDSVVELSVDTQVDDYNNSVDNTTLFAFRTGHPPHTDYFKLIDTRTGAERRVSLPSDMRYAEIGQYGTYRNRAWFTYRTPEVSGNILSNPQPAEWGLARVSLSGRVWKSHVLRLQPGEEVRTICEADDGVCRVHIAGLNRTVVQKVHVDDGYAITLAHASQPIHRVAPGGIRSTIPLDRGHVAVLTESNSVYVGDGSLTGTHAAFSVSELDISDAEIESIHPAGPNVIAVVRQPSPNFRTSRFSISHVRSLWVLGPDRPARPLYQPNFDWETIYQVDTAATGGVIFSVQPIAVGGYDEYNPGQTIYITRPDGLDYRHVLENVGQHVPLTWYDWGSGATRTLVRVHKDGLTRSTAPSVDRGMTYYSIDPDSGSAVEISTVDDFSTDIFSPGRERVSIRGNRADYSVVRRLGSNRVLVLYSANLINASVNRLVLSEVTPPEWSSVSVDGADTPTYDIAADSSGRFFRWGDALGHWSVAEETITWFRAPEGDLTNALRSAVADSGRLFLRMQSGDNQTTLHVFDSVSGDHRTIQYEGSAPGWLSQVAPLRLPKIGPVDGDQVWVDALTRINIATGEISRIESDPEFTGTVTAWGDRFNNTQRLFYRGPGEWVPLYFDADRIRLNPRQPDPAIDDSDLQNAPVTASVGLGDATVDGGGTDIVVRTADGVTHVGSAHEIYSELLLDEPLGRITIDIGAVAKSDSVRRMTVQLAADATLEIVGESLDTFYGEADDQFLIQSPGFDLIASLGGDVNIIDRTGGTNKFRMRDVTITGSRGGDQFTLAFAGEERRITRMTGDQKYHFVWPVSPDGLTNPWDASLQRTSIFLQPGTGTDHLEIDSSASDRFSFSRHLIWNDNVDATEPATFKFPENVMLRKFDNNDSIVPQTLLHVDNLSVALHTTAIPLSNPSNSFDVDGNARLEIADALAVINCLRSGIVGSPNSISFPDVDDDGAITVSDALLVVNELRRHRSLADEGEFIRVAAVDAVFNSMPQSF